MKDPRKPITKDTYSHGLMVIFFVASCWALAGIWLEVPDLLEKLILSFVIISVALLLTWPVLKKTEMKYETNIYGREHSDPNA